MGVYIEGMEMPKNCAECKMWSICECLKEFNDYESLLYAVDDGDLVRDKNCPLVEIPTPHGRLIDADELKSRLVLDNDSNELQRISADILKWIDIQETVIEAEGETDA